MDFAKKNNLAVIALSYSSAEKIYIGIAKVIIGRSKVLGKRCLMKSGAFMGKICRFFSMDFRAERNLPVALWIGVPTELSHGVHIRRNFGIIRKTVAK